MTNHVVNPLFFIALLIASCTSNHPPTAMLPSPAQVTSASFPTQPVFIAQPTLAPTATFTPIPTATFTPMPTPTEAWIVQGPGDVTVPILLYHHVADSPISNRYVISPQKFETQMKILHDWGYTSITTTMLIQAITEGAALPPRPFLLTLDDGNLDNYTNAFPIAEKYGFHGVLYLVVNYIGSENYMNVEQILEMYHAGWEIGSHSLNHFDLAKVDAATARNEIIGSRAALEDMLGVPILTFAYPFGEYNDTALEYVKAAGYQGAMGAKG
ncbi:MAG: polysaccharide deacetylase family protein, partial [Anaerolineales bacterium]